MAAWIPADASCVPFPNADALTVAQTVLRTGMPPAAIIPGFQDVRRSAPRIGSVVGPAAPGLSPWQAGAAEAAISSIAVAIPAVLVIIPFPAPCAVTTDLLLLPGAPRSWRPQALQPAQRPAL